mgnify:FL=1
MQSNVAQNNRSLNIAVIGTGIAGMSAAWLLSKRHQITVFEQNERIGGHTSTVELDVKKKKVPIDTGFIVYNEKNYPNFVQLLKYLAVQTQPAEMSFSVSLDQGKFEYGTRNINSFFGQRSNILKPEFWIMLNDIRKFFREASKFDRRRMESSSITVG